jgi:general secretion pathway protein G
MEPAKKKQVIIISLIVGGGLFLVFLLIAGLLAAIAIPSFLRAREISRRNQCEEYLSRIDGAKQQWALENNASVHDVPTWLDLIGEDLYIRQSPVCPSGGQYIIGAINEDPTCSLSTDPDFPHTLDNYY